MHVGRRVQTFSKFQLITSVPLLFALIAGTHGLLTHTPKNSVASKGSTKVFTCCTDIVEKTIFWKHKPVGSANANDIYDSNGFVNGFLSSGRFSMPPGSSRGCHSLTTTNVRLEDGGTYICTDAEGLGQMMGWELVILESFNCQETYHKTEYMGENDFGLPQDVISAACISNYFGNVPPKPICEWSSGTQRLDNYYHATETNSTTTLNINIPARKEFNGDQLLCYVKIEEAPRANQSQTRWKSNKFNISYALYQQQCVSQCNGDKASLGCDCQPPCSYKLGKFQNSSLYCEITYPIQPDGTSKVMLIENTDSEAHPNSISWTGWITAICCGISGIAIGGLIGMVVYCIRKRCPVKCAGMTETGKGINITCCAASPNDSDNVKHDAQEVLCNIPSNVHRQSKNLGIKNNNKESEMLLDGAHGRITLAPNNSIVLNGETKVFTCCSDGQETFLWRLTPDGSKTAKDIYDLNGLANGFLTSGRFKVTNDRSPGCQSLTTSNVSQGDAGRYTCVDNDGLGQSTGWELVVLKSFDCQEENSKSEYMGLNNFDLPQDIIYALCILKYVGNIPPRPVCEWSSGTKLLDNYHRVIEANATTFISYIQIPARKELNGDQLSCYAKIEEDLSAKQNSTTWKSTKFKVNYALFQSNGVPQHVCENSYMDCQPQCNYSLRVNDNFIYCEVTYPTKTHPKLNVLLLSNNIGLIEKVRAFYPISSAEERDSKQRQKTIEIISYVGIAICSFILAIMLTCCLVGCYGGLRRGKNVTATTPRQNANGGDILPVQFDPASGTFSLNVQQNEEDNNHEVDPMLGAETPHQEANEVNSIIVQINPASDSNSLNVLQNLNCDTKNNNEEDKSLLEGI